MQIQNYKITPILFIVSAPSGAGKTTLLEKLISANPNIHLTVSCTTREARVGELSGKNYNFITKAEFEKNIADGQFAEYANVHDNYYGTPKSEIENAIVAGKDVIAEIDWQGARSLRSVYPHSVSVFILPPSLEELSKRLRVRAKDIDSVIDKRIAKAGVEVSKVNDFDYFFVNNDFTQAFENLNNIFRAAKFLRKQEIDLTL